MNYLQSYVITIMHRICGARSCRVWPALLCAFLIGCDSQLKENPSAVSDSTLPTVRLLANELVDKPDSSAKAVTPSAERLSGEWQYKAGASTYELRWLPHSDVDANLSNSPDGMLLTKYKGFGAGEGTGAYDVVFDTTNDRIEIYEAGSINADGTSTSNHCATAILVGDNLITLRGSLKSERFEWTIDSTFTKLETPNKAVHPSGG